MLMRFLTLIFCFLALTPVITQAQERTVTPVVPVTSRPTPPVKQKKAEEPKSSARPQSVVEMTDDLGNTLLIDTISGSEWVDSIALQQAKVIANVYPLWDAVNVGVDLWPALGRAFGQDQGLVGIWGRLSLHNRYFPVVEVGISNASNKPASMNYTYKSSIAPYFKVGLDYNIFYNSNSDYQAYVMFRYGLTNFSYDVSNVTITDGYWQETDNLSLPRQSTTTGYLEVGAGLVVKLFGQLSAGWNIKYHKILHHSAEKFGAPWSVPGFGVRTGSLGVQLSLIYTIPLHAPIPDPNSDKDSK